MLSVHKPNVPFVSVFGLHKSITNVAHNRNICSLKSPLLCISVAHSNSIELPHVSVRKYAFGHINRLIFTLINWLCMHSGKRHTVMYAWPFGQSHRFSIWLNRQSHAVERKIVHFDIVRNICVSVNMKSETDLRTAVIKSSNWFHFNSTIHSSSNVARWHFYNVT